MTKKKKANRYHVEYQSPIYYVPDLTGDPPLPSTLLEIEREMMLLLAAMEKVEREISDKGMRIVAPRWDGYLALGYSLMRRNWFSDQWRGAFRRCHSSVAKFMDLGISSFHEAAFDVCGLRLEFLDECVPCKEIDASLPLRTQLFLRANALAKEGEYISRNWRFPNLNFGELCAGIKLECDRATPPKPEPLCRLRIENSADPHIFLDGRGHPVSGNVAELFQAAVDANGSPVSMSKFGVRSRDIDSLHPSLREVIKRETGKGCWVPREKLWLS